MRHIFRFWCILDSVCFLIGLLKTSLIYNTSTITYFVPKSSHLSRFVLKPFCSSSEPRLRFSQCFSSVDNVMIISSRIQWVFGMFAKFWSFAKCHVFFSKMTGALTCSGLKQAPVAETISPVVPKLFLREQMLPVRKDLEITFPPLSPFEWISFHLSSLRSL